MNQDSQFKLQAYLDGELSATETTEVETLLSGESSARALLEELRGTNAVLAGHEAECKLPESREFFWSKIEKEILRQSSQDAPAPVLQQSWFTRWQRYFLPVGGVALILCLCAVLGKNSAKASSQFGEMELASDDVGAYTFRDQQQQMTTVWLYDRNGDDSQFTHVNSADSVEQ